MATRKTSAAGTAKKTSKQKEPSVPTFEADESSATARFHSAREYQVYFTNGVFSGENPALASAIARMKASGATGRVFAVVDYNVARQTQDLPARAAAALAAAGAEAVGKPALAPGGEQCKNDGGRTALALANTFLNAGAGAGDCILAIGGGSVLDAAGFAVSMLHGGTHFIRMPTTLLAQCASGSAFKASVDSQGVKDSLSLPCVPDASIVDFSFLSSLTPENLRNGIPEAIKTAAVCDRDFLAWIDANASALLARNAPCIEELVRRTVSLQLKAAAECGDPAAYARSGAANFGVWTAGRIEALANWRLWHGYALATGMCIDVAYAVQNRWLTEEEGDAICTAIYKTGGMYGAERFGSVLDNAEKVAGAIDERIAAAAGCGAFAFPGPAGEAHLEDGVDAGIYAKIVAEFRRTSREMAEYRRARAAAEGRPAEPPPEEPPSGPEEETPAAENEPVRDAEEAETQTAPSEAPEEYVEPIEADEL